MQTALLPIMRDYLVRFQQTAIKETGRRPLCWLRSPKDEALVIPEYGIQKGLAPGDNVIEFTPTETGTFPYSCWMGMIRSSITVEP